MGSQCTRENRSSGAADVNTTVTVILVSCRLVEEWRGGIDSLKGESLRKPSSYGWSKSKSCLHPVGDEVSTSALMRSLVNPDGAEVWPGDTSSRLKAFLAGGVAELHVDRLMSAQPNWQWVICSNDDVRSGENADGMTDEPMHTGWVFSTSLIPW